MNGGVLDHGCSGWDKANTQMYCHFSKYLKCENCLCVLRTNENVLLM